MADDYVCTLDEASIKVAQEELHEDPKERMSQVEALRTWLIQQPHIRANTDTKALLPFLRAAKFSQLKTRQMIEKTMILKTEVPEWFSDIDSHDPKMKAFLSSGYVARLPGRLDGQVVLLFRNGLLDLSNKHYDKPTFMKAMSAVFQHAIQEELTQVHGLVLIQDFTSVPSGLLTFFSIEDIKKITKMYEGTFPSRIKGFHYYNQGSIFEAMMAISKPLMSKKMQSRIHIHGHNLESLYKVIPQEMLPDEYLPDDYIGSSAGPVQKLVDKLVEDLTAVEYRNFLLQNSGTQYGVDESKRPKDVPQESFRKLNID